GSVKDVEKALAYEVLRQKEAFLKGVSVRSETRHWDDVRKVTVPLRVKEEEQDYRYFPEADIPPIIITDDYIEKIAKRMPELPDERIKRFQKEYGLPQYDASVLVSNKKLADFFEEAVKLYGGNPKKVANVIINDFLRWRNHKH
ncbi:MAG: Asp-tRNA(Asn)/Glu-tRNA(Gln) amidotransferase GatCAB subunit B, partial [Desulfurococcales archaeon ex4484_217_1]